MKSLTRFEMKHRVLAVSSALTPPDEIKDDALAPARGLIYGSLIAGSIWFIGYWLIILLFHIFRAS